MGEDQCDLRHLRQRGLARLAIDSCFDVSSTDAALWKMFGREPMKGSRLLMLTDTQVLPLRQAGLERVVDFH